MTCSDKKIFSYKVSVDPNNNAVSLNSSTGVLRVFSTNSQSLGTYTVKITGTDLFLNSEIKKITLLIYSHCMNSVIKINE